MPNLREKEARTRQTGLDLYSKIWKKISSAKQSDTLIASITQMTRAALKAQVSSLYLLDEQSQELFLKSSDGPVEKQLKRFQVNNGTGLTGWVAQNGRPIIVNDAENDPRFKPLVDEIYGIPTKSIICTPLILHRRVIGVIKVVNKAGGAGFSDADLKTLNSVTAAATLTIDNARLNECLKYSYKSTVNALVALADAKETTGGGHSKRVARYAMLGADSLSLPDEEKQAIEYAAILHDIGKMAIPDSILNKSGTLSHEEWILMRRHPEIGYNMLKSIPFLEEASRLILFHHERFDGKGYPYGIKGEAIPMGARLIAVADAFDIMTTEHAYRTALSRKYAFAELSRNMRTQFCPVAVKAFYSGLIKSLPAEHQKAEHQNRTGRRT